jgi:DNA-binding response OmpR family regulator
MDTIYKHAPDLILLDIMLGSMDGRELCKEVKNTIATHDIPVILISASHNISNAMNQDGAPNDFIAKPFDINNLLAKIKNQLRPPPEPQEGFIPKAAIPYQFAHSTVAADRHWYYARFRYRIVFAGHLFPLRHQISHINRPVVIAGQLAFRLIFAS